MRLNNSHRRYRFVAGYPLAFGVSVHDPVFDFPHQLIHSWPGERGRPLSGTCDPRGCPI